MSTIAVIGASRGIGLATVREACGAGYHVRAMARSEAPQGLSHPALQWIRGDATLPQDLARTIDGCDAVIQTLGVGNPFGFSPITLFSRSTRHLVDAMERSGLRRLIVVTGFGAGDSRGHGSLVYERLVLPLILGRIYEDKDVQEEIVRQSSLDWTVLRPGLLTNGVRTGKARVLVSPDEWHLGSISRADVAAVLVREVAEARYLRQTPVVIS